MFLLSGHAVSPDRSGDSRMSRVARSIKRLPPPGPNGGSAGHQFDEPPPTAVDLRGPAEVRFQSTAGVLEGGRCPDDPGPNPALVLAGGGSSERASDRKDGPEARGGGRGSAGAGGAESGRRSR